MQVILIAAGIIFLGVSWYFLNLFNASQPGASYTTEDIVYTHPLHAVHEMSGGNLDGIPFLPQDEPQPKIVLLQDFHNFGNVGPTEVLTYDFIISNQGEAPLTISRAYTTCGCTTAEFTATIIPPGKFAVVTMRLDAGFHDVSGQTVRRGIIIENNDPKNPLVELWAQASVRAKP